MDSAVEHLTTLASRDVHCIMEVAVIIYICTCLLLLSDWQHTMLLERAVCELTNVLSEIFPDLNVVGRQDPAVVRRQFAHTHVQEKRTNVEKSSSADQVVLHNALNDRYIALRYHHA